MTPRLSSFKRILFIFTGIGLAVALTGCDLLNAKQFRIRVTSSFDDFTGVYSKNGTASKSFGGKQVTGDFYEYTKEIDFESVEVTVTKADSSAILKISIYENDKSVTSAKLDECDNDVTLTLEYTADTGTGDSDSDSSGNDSNSDEVKTGIAKATSTAICDGTSTTEPDEPNIESLDAAGSTSVTVTLTDPNDSTITSYIIYFSTDGTNFDDQEKASSVWDTSTDGEIGLTLTGLTASTEYTIYVTAVASAESDPSDTDTVTTDP